MVAGNGGNFNDLVAVVAYYFSQWVTWHSKIRFFFSLGVSFLLFSAEMTGLPFVLMGWVSIISGFRSGSGRPLIFEFRAVHGPALAKSLYRKCYLQNIHTLCVYYIKMVRAYKNAWAQVWSIEWSGQKVDLGITHSPKNRAKSSPMWAVLGSGLVHSTLL